nr:MAG TPA: hypothetical protein [Caudoviricetes sp.]
MCSHENSSNQYKKSIALYLLNRSHLFPIQYCYHFIGQ